MHDPRPAGDVAAGRRWPRSACWPRAVGGVPGRRPMSEHRPTSRRPTGEPGRRRRSGAAAAATAHQMVPDVEFTSYYGRPVVKASPWEADIPAYLFLGGLAAGSSLLARRRRPDRPAGAAARRPARRAGRDHAQLRRAGARPRPAGAVPQHAAGGQADLADVGRHLDPHRVRAAGRAGRRGRAARAGRCRAACAGPGPAARRAGRPGRARRGGRRARRSRPTPRCCWPTPPRRPGTRPTASCRSSSSARPRRRRAGWACSAPRRPRPGPARRLAVGRRRRRAGRRAADGGVDGPGRRAAARRARPGTLMRASKALTAAGALGALLGAAQPGGRRRSSGAALLAGSACTRFGDLRGRPGLGPRPEVHRRAAARAAVDRRAAWHCHAPTDAAGDRRSADSMRRAGARSRRSPARRASRRPRSSPPLVWASASSSSSSSSTRGVEVRAHPVEVAPGAAADEAVAQRLAGAVEVGHGGRVDHGRDARRPGPSCTGGRAARSR